jgi:hypothetical protein
MRRATSTPVTKQDSFEVFGRPMPSNSASLSLALELESMMALEKEKEMARKKENESRQRSSSSEDNNVAEGQKGQKGAKPLSGLFRSRSLSWSLSRSRSRSTTRPAESQEMGPASRLRRPLSRSSMSKGADQPEHHSEELEVAEESDLEELFEDTQTVGTKETVEVEKYSNDVLSFVHQPDDMTIETEDSEEEIEEEEEYEGQETIWRPALENGAYAELQCEDELEKETKIDHEGQEAIWTEKVTFVASSKKLRTMQHNPRHPTNVKKLVVLPGPSEFPIATISF